ncbi:MAG: hypothetical protein LUG99_10560 [Lachnospiraceae bacterium]|nr:hypothetical protein [Lachnospiraceae bacterium]
MKKIRLEIRLMTRLVKIRDMAFGAAILLCIPVCMGGLHRITVQAEESGYSESVGDLSGSGEMSDAGSGSQEFADAAASDKWGEAASGNLDVADEAGLTDGADAALEDSQGAIDGEVVYLEDVGSYTMEEGWSLDETQSTDDVSVYVQDAYADEAQTSTISCSYLSTNYSRQDYEQLRDMLTNNLLYSNVNAQITTSAVYTLAMDYLYIILVDDSSEDYRDIYHYVVGDYECFCVQVREYRDEAAEAEAQELQTPQEAGQSVAEGFVW